MICKGSSLTFSAQGGWGKEKELKPAEKIFCRSEDGSAGGGWGEECRAVRAKDRGRTRRPARQSRAPQKSFVFLLEEKNGRAQKENRKQNFSVVWRELASGGGAASLVGVLRKVSSDFFKQTPPKLISCLGRGFAPRFGRHFRKEMPRVSEIHRQNSRREAAVPKRSLDCAFSARADERFLEIVGVSAAQLNHAIL